MESIESLLHHRDPYLMIDEIVEISSDQVRTSKQVRASEIYTQGHFPGAPVVPGAMLQEMCTQSAGLIIAKFYNPMNDYNTHDPFHNKFALGVLKRVISAKFNNFAKPGDRLNIKVKLDSRLDSLFSFSAVINCEKQKLMSMKFLLCNIESRYLYSV